MGFAALAIPFWTRGEVVSLDVCPASPANSAVAGIGLISGMSGLIVHPDAGNSGYQDSNFRPGAIYACLRLINATPANAIAKSAIDVGSGTAAAETISVETKMELPAAGDPGPPAIRVV